MGILFISDLHLDPGDGRTLDSFLAFLAGPGSEAQAIYILGDLFEAWIGDDEENELSRAVASSLAKRARADCAVYFQHGNRDFLLGKDFARNAGMTLLPEEHVIEHFGERVLLMHGDSLCMGDDAYQAFRRQTRNAAWQAGFLHRSLAERREFAKHARRESRQYAANLERRIGDVDQAAVAEKLRQWRCDHLIHGHTHRQAVHCFHDQGVKTRIVLGDWHQSPSVLRWDLNGFQLLGNASMMLGDKYIL